jgi:hypothetical protein
VEFARSLWLRIETLHAVTYFGEETQEAGRALGASGFWMGYFGFRAAPLGAVAPGAVDAAFANFAPAFVRRWVPGAWSVAPPEAFVAARSAAAAETLRRVADDLDATARATAPFLDAAIADGSPIGRPLFAANRDLDLPADPVEALWQRCTTLREHRGDGHVAALAAAGVDGLEAHVLIALDLGSDPVDLQRTRGWKAEDWTAAVERLQHRNLVDDRGALSDAGRALRRDVEHTTDRLAGEPWHGLDEVERTRLVELLTPPAAAVSAAGILRYPNPIGLPPIT